MSFVQPPRKRKCFLEQDQLQQQQQETLEETSMPQPPPTPPPTPSLASQQMVEHQTMMKQPKIEQQQQQQQQQQNDNMAVFPGDEEFSKFIQMAIELATNKHRKEQILVGECQSLKKKIEQFEMTRNEKGGGGGKTPSSTVSSPSSVKNNSNHHHRDHSHHHHHHHSSEDQQPSSNRKLEQRNRELERNLELTKRDLTQCSQLLSKESAKCAEKEMANGERVKEIEKLKQELAQTRQRLDGFVKSASEQATRAKSVQEELANERELRAMVEGKLRAANECVMLGKEFEQRLKKLFAEKCHLEQELAKFKAATTNLSSTSSSPQTPQISSPPLSTSSPIILSGSVRQFDEKVLVNNNNNKNHRKSQETQTEALFSLLSNDDNNNNYNNGNNNNNNNNNGKNNDDEIGRLQSEIDTLQQQLSFVVSGDDKNSQSSPMPNVVDNVGSLELFNNNNDNNEEEEGEGEGEEEAEADELNQVEILKQRCFAIEQELEKRKETMEWHHKTWIQKCESFRLLEEKVRDRDIQCAKYHFELEVSEKFF